MEAELQLKGLSLGDRWRVDPLTGRPVLTLRRIYVHVWLFPSEAGPFMQAVTGSVPWTRMEHLLDDLRRTQLATHGAKNPKPHPDRVKKSAKKQAADLAKRRRKNQERAARRRRELEGMG